MSKCTCNRDRSSGNSITETAGGLRRDLMLKPGFVCERDISDPRSHGKHGMELVMALCGDVWAVTFVSFLGLMPDGSLVGEPMGADVSVHALGPLYEGQEITNPSCEWLGGRPCYTDGSALLADQYLAVFLREGPRGVWPMLESQAAKSMEAKS